MKKYKAFICSHTHWDREWYITFQEIRFRLIHLVDKLKKLLKNKKGYNYFNFDGQTIFIEDYLEAMPDDKDFLNLIEQGKILIGPWYTLPDEFIPSGESLIKNLEIGHSLVKKYKGVLVKTGYIPDTFGHISQMPQILKGFNLDTAIFWRGINRDKAGGEFEWSSPDGSSVLVKHLLADMGYCNILTISDSPDKTADDVITTVKKLLKHQKADVILLLDGIDHRLPLDKIPDLINVLNKKSKDTEFIHSNFNEFINAFKQDIQNKKSNLKKIKGEIRDTNFTEGAQWNYILPNVLSSRIYLTQMNDLIETELSKWIEPYSGFLKSDKKYSNYAELMWKKAAANHAHDSIGGCSIDQVHREMEVRYEELDQMSDLVNRKLFLDLANNINTAVILKSDEAGLLILNNSSEIKNENIEIEFFIPDEIMKKFPEIKNHDCIKWIFLIDEDKNRHELELLDIKRASKSVPFENIIMFGKQDGIAIRGNFIAENIPSYGYKLYKLEFKTRKEDLLIYSKHRTTEMENDYYKIQINQNGSFNIKDKMNSIEFNEFGYFESRGDCGGGYAFSPPIFDKVITSLNSTPIISKTNNNVIERCLIEYRMLLPASLSEDNKSRSEKFIELPIKAELILGKKTNMISMNIEVINTIKSHRLQVAFPTAINSQYFYTLNPFDLIYRKIEKIEVPDKVWIEDQPLQYPMQGLTGIESTNRSISIFAKGLKEVEPNPAKELKITLYRAVKYLSGGAPHIITRNNYAGPGIETPGAQMINRKLKFQLGLTSYKGKIEETDILKKFDRFYTQVKTVSVDSHKGKLPVKDAFIDVETSHILISTIKQPQQEKGLIIRLFNPLQKPDKIKIRFKEKISGIEEVNFLEEKTGKEIKINNKTVELNIASKKIKTLLCLY